MNTYEMVTEKILNELSKGIIPWRKPWFGTAEAVSYVTGKPYSLLNQILLGKPGEYLTFNQVAKMGGKVKKGEKASFVVFWKFLETDTGDLDAKGEPIMKTIPFLKYFNVFHIDQTEGIPAKHVVPVETAAEPDVDAQVIFNAYTIREGIKVHTGSAAFYRPGDDSITLPALNTFINTAEYYSTAFHEAVHSTGAKTRLDRLTGTAFFGNEEYSKEELTAEIGASMLINRVGLDTESAFRNNVAYLQNWMKALKDDNKLIVGAASKAEKAVRFILGEEEPTEA